MALASAIAFAACAPASPVRWDEVQPLATAIDDASILVFTGDSVVTLVRDDASLAVPGGAVCEVQDKGWIRQPLVGRARPGIERKSGRGLWIVNQLCDLVQLRSSPAGTVARLHMRRR